MGDTSDIKAGDIKASGGAPADQGDGTASRGWWARSWFGQHWRGELPLDMAFWINGILGYLVVIRSLVRMMKAVNDEFPWEIYPVLSRVVAVPGFVCILACMIWQCVGIWRSAPHYQGPRFWAIGARLMIGVFILWLSSPLLYMLYASLNDAQF